MNSLVSVILPVHNRASWIARAVESVLAQTYRPLELIVVDDGSTDDLRAVLAPYAGELTLLEQARGGAYAARNLALRHARGELVAFIDSDDAWLPHRLEKQVPLFERPEVGLVFGNARVVTAEGPTGRTMFDISPPRRGRVASEFAWSNFVPTVTATVRREALGAFDEEPVSSDYLAWFRVAQRYEVEYVDDVVADYTVHSGGISRDLGRSLDARIRLFGTELERTADPAARAVLERLLFHLSVLLGLAAVRGRAGTVRHPIRTAWRTASRTGGPSLAAAFAMHLARTRGRRLFS